MTRFRLAAGQTFRALQVRNYRLYFFGQVVSVSGTWMQSVALGWLVLRLTGSGIDLGLVTALQFVPMLLLGSWGGLVADRLDKRRVLFCTQSFAAAARPRPRAAGPHGRDQPVADLPVGGPDRGVQPV